MEPENKPIHHIKVLSYNTLVQKYPFTQSVKNDSGWRSYSWASRREQLILKIVSQSTDVICLQQIWHASKSSTPNYFDFYTPLFEMGFGGVFAKRNITGEFGNEGLATFYNRQLYTLVHSQVLYYQDGTGRHALAVTLRSHAGCIFTVVNTHLIYPSQMQETQKEVETLAGWSCLYQKNIPCILAGDFNLCKDVSSHRVLLNKFAERFNDVHEVVNCKKGTFSLNLYGSNCPGMIQQIMGTKIDYIFASKDIQVGNADVLGSLTDLPTQNQPSDHLPIISALKVPCLYNLVIEDIQKLKQIFIEVRERNYGTNPKFQQFLNLFWLLPQSIQNAAYDLTYKKAVKLGLYEQNFQFGRIAFTNNTYHIEAILDQDGNQKKFKWEVVKHDLIPHEVILDILDIIEERVVVIPQLILAINNIDFGTFLDKFDNKLHIQTCHQIYGEVYKIACAKSKNTQHMQFGRVSFRNLDGWTIQNTIRIEAMKKLQLP